MRKLSNQELNRVDVDTFKQMQKHRIVLVLDNVRSLNNVGSAFRTADAFGIEAIYLCGITATPPNKEIHKTALGAEETVEWKYFENTMLAIENLKLQNYKIASIEQAENATMLNDYHTGKIEPIALVFGNEVSGVEQQVIDESDMVIEIPQWGTKHSLNVSVSIGVVLWQIINAQL